MPVIIQLCVHVGKDYLIFEFDLSLVSWSVQGKYLIVPKAILIATPSLVNCLRHFIPQIYKTLFWY